MHLYSFLLGVGSLHGLLMAVVLWRSPSVRKVNNKFLALILLFFAYRLAVDALFALEIASQRNWLYHILLEYNWIYGSLLYFYVSSYLDKNFTLKRKDWIHFLPVVLEFVFSNFIKIQNFYWDGTKESLSYAGYWGYVIWEHTPFQLIVSLGLVLFYIHLSYKRLGEETNLREEGSQWLRRILTSFRMFAVVVLLAGLVDYFFLDYAFNPVHVFPTYIGLAILTYWLGLEGFSRRNKPLPISKKTKQSVEEAKSLKEKLDEIMTAEALYKDSTLTVAKLAGRLNIQPYQLTQYLNEEEQLNFNDFVNAYRVEALKKALTDSAYDHLSLLGVAMEVGFNSKATFNRAVKKATGLTPGQLRQSLSDK
jgi:AraC-like DNA-binding protein